MQGYTSKLDAGESQLFSPKSIAVAIEEVSLLLHRSPSACGFKRARWRLQDIGRALTWLEGKSDAGIYKVLKRLGFSRKQALQFIHSPDPDFRSKWQRILYAYQEALVNPEEVILLFEDELTYYRYASKAPDWHPRGKKQPKARQHPGVNSKRRIAAVLNALTGKVTYIQRTIVGKQALVSFYRKIRATYPQAKKIYLVEDNWPVHKEPAVLQAASDQRLTLLFLPTYASWLNPIEKLWRWLKQDIIHLHRHQTDLLHLRDLVSDFLDQFAHGSRQLLNYVGIMPVDEPYLIAGLNC